MYELAPNTTLYNGKYKIQKVLGQGTFGITYLATDTCENRNVAIKEFFMKETNTRGEDSTVTGSQSEIFIKYKDKFHKEAINLSKMSGFDDIITVYEAFEDNNTAYYAMEYIDGGNLNDYIASNDKLSEDEAIRNIRMVAIALQRLHESRMLHLDLKPSNIMRRRDGNLVLIDFGLAKQYDANGKAESSSSIGLGSPGYAPIEQQNFKGEFAPTLDIYALGATFYKMLTGQTAPVSTDIFDTGFAPLANRMSSLGVSNQAITAVEKAMKSQKRERYQSVDEFVKALPEVKEPETIETVNNNADSKTMATPIKKGIETVEPKTKKSKTMKIALGVVLAVLILIICIVIRKKNASENEFPRYQNMYNQIEQIVLDLEYGNNKSDETLIREIDSAKYLLQNILKMDNEYGFVNSLYRKYNSLRRKLDEGIVNFESEHSPIIIKNLTFSKTDNGLQFQADIISFQDERIIIDDQLWEYCDEWKPCISSLGTCKNGSTWVHNYDDFETEGSLIRYIIMYDGTTYEISEPDRRIKANSRIIADTIIRLDNDNISDVGN